MKKLSKRILSFSIATIISLMYSSASGTITFDKENQKYYNYSLYCDDEFDIEPISEEHYVEGKRDVIDRIYIINGVEIRVKIINNNMPSIPFYTQMRDAQINQCLNTLKNLNPEVLDLIMGYGNNEIDFNEYAVIGKDQAGSYTISTDLVKILTANQVMGEEAYRGTESIIHEMMHKMDHNMISLVLGVDEFDPIKSMYSYNVPDWINLYESKGDQIIPILKSGYKEIPNLLEFFAEVGTAYFCVPERLKNDFPEAYELFDITLKHGLELKRNYNRKSK